MTGAGDCGGVHGERALSFFTATTAGFLLITTVVSNLLILLTIYRNKGNVFKPLFYRIIFNISLADLFTGLVVDTLCLNYVLKEGLNLSLDYFEVELAHMTFFVFSGVSVITMGLLSIERLWVLMCPFHHLKGLAVWKIALILSSTWVLSILVSLSYLKVGFVHAIAVFASSTVVLSFVLMVITFVVYYQRLVKNHGSQNRNSVKTKLQPVRSSTASQLKKNYIHGEKRVTKTFILMLFVFLVSYLPTCIMMLYMNTCVKCHCMLIHVMRDLTFLFMVAGALFRPINFICRLKILRKAVLQIVTRAFSSESDKSFGEVSFRRASQNNKV